jgi:hypothetical protein
MLAWAFLDFAKKICADQCCRSGSELDPDSVRSVNQDPGGGG